MTSSQRSTARRQFVLVALVVPMIIAATSSCAREDLSGTQALTAPSVDVGVSSAAGVNAGVPLTIEGNITCSSSSDAEIFHGWAETPAVQVVRAMVLGLGESFRTDDARGRPHVGTPVTVGDLKEIKVSSRSIVGADNLVLEGGQYENITSTFPQTLFTGPTGQSLLVLTRGKLGDQYWQIDVSFPMLNDQVLLGFGCSNGLGFSETETEHVDTDVTALVPGHDDGGKVSAGRPIAAVNLADVEALLVGK